MHLRLKILSGSNQFQRVFAIGPGRTFVGRHPKCSICVDSDTLSKTRASVTDMGGTYWLEDCKSRCGTMVNQVRTRAPTLLQNGDKIRVGTVDFCAEFSD
jgi:pSer/pThr/pTyr-binding forkhead associated (FHA) protein